MNKLMAAVVIILAVAVALLSASVFYLSKGTYQRQFDLRSGFGNRTQKQMPFAMNQQPKGLEKLSSAFGPEGQSQRPPQALFPGQMAGPSAGDHQQQRGQGQQPGQSMAPGAGQQQQPGRQAMGGSQGQSGSQQQVSKIMQEATQQAQNYFRSQKRKPQHQEMLAKVKELMTQKMNEQGIAKDVQQKVLSEMDTKSPPQQSQQRQQ